MEKDILQAAGRAFVELTKIEYHIILGRKGHTTTLDVVFQPENFYHLAGLHKLKMRYDFQQRTSAWILSNIVKGKISARQIEQDENYIKVYARLLALMDLAAIIEDDDTKFYAYEHKKVFFATKIVADYLAKGSCNNEIITFSFFVKEADRYCVNSIFPMENYDYSMRQTQYTVLLKEKIVYIGGEKIRNELYRHKKYMNGGEGNEQT